MGKPDIIILGFSNVLTAAPPAHIRAPAAADVQDRPVRALPGDIALRPGELWIQLAKLLELSHAMANDSQSLSCAVEEELGPPLPVRSV